MKLKKLIKKEQGPRTIINKALDTTKLWDNIVVKLVDGASIRNNKNVEFTMGGHHYIYDFIPENEIWIDQDMQEEDIIATSIHEFTERAIMKYNYIDYDDAHDVASAAEKVIRKAGGYHKEEDNDESAKEDGAIDMYNMDMYGEY